MVRVVRQREAGDGQAAGRLPDAAHDVPDGLILLRAMRPDRSRWRCTQYVGEMYGHDYVFQTPFDMKATYRRRPASTPVFFVLFPGVDPTPWVEDLGKTLDITAERGMFCNISMGQGQERPAEAMRRALREGGRLGHAPELPPHDVVGAAARAAARGRAGARARELPLLHLGRAAAMASMKNMPESLLQSCVKVANEAPADIKSNVTRAWAEFSQERIDSCTGSRSSSRRASSRSAGSTRSCSAAGASARRAGRASTRSTRAT